MGNITKNDYFNYFIFNFSIMKPIILISEKDALPTITTQQGQTVYIGLPIYYLLLGLSNHGVGHDNFV